MLPCQHSSPITHKKLRLMIPKTLLRETEMKGAQNLKEVKEQQALDLSVLRISHYLHHAVKEHLVASQHSIKEKFRSNQVSVFVMDEKTSHQTDEGHKEGCLPIENEESISYTASHHIVDKEAGLATCRVCQCVESDGGCDSALGFLGISPPSCDVNNSNFEVNTNAKVLLKNVPNDSGYRNDEKGSSFVEFISPDGDVFVCSTDVELGYDHNQDRLVELGCACKSDLALAHYACALKWFINHGSTVCEICGSVAKNIRSADFKKVLSALKEYEVSRERIVNGEPNPAPLATNFGVDPVAVAAIRRQRLSEISLWFNPHSNSSTVSQVVSEPPSTNMVMEEGAAAENTATKWAVEGTGILLATGLLTVTLAWLIAPYVGKKTAKNDLHVLLGGICALTVVVSFRFFVLTRIKYGPARYWAVLFVFWFLVFGIWASRTHGDHAK
ncbi:involved in mRNA turnover and stability [Olea europaea subsp. europaea]|uniref:Involved in mRNA turnover and stability n=2 Tax=Olea europaea subsp. europaea TaxID=158383 RepID=A0A8S0UA41_OLEEU|nr:involved in mRNA turnover and stability [Olea europaea subsp. europaea]